MAVDVKLIAIFLIIPLWISAGVAAVELRIGDVLQLNCTIVHKLDSWDILQSAPTPIAIVKLKQSGSYSCTGRFLAPGRNIVCRTGVSINTVTGKDITISSIDYDDAGTYFCTTGDEIQSTEVIVAQNDGPTLQYSLQNSDTSTQPANNVVTRGSTLTFNCTIRFGGLKAPAMELLFRGSKGAERLLATSSSNVVPFNSNQIAVVTTDYSVSSTDTKFSIVCRLPSFAGISEMTYTLNFSAISASSSLSPLHVYLQLVFIAVVLTLL